MFEDILKKYYATEDGIVIGSLPQPPQDWHEASSEIPSNTYLPRASGSSEVQSNVSLAAKFTFRGLNIQWPFSQLLLHGSKTVEIRKIDEVRECEVLLGRRDRPSHSSGLP